MTTEKVKGFNDFVGKEASKRAEIKRFLAEAFERYGFEPAETPIIEYGNFVKQGNEGDEAISDIFKLKDKGKRDLALRYEFTFQLKRIAKNKKLPYKRYQIGEVFRDEPATSSRFRQFTQCDVDTIGSTVRDEAEILALSNYILKSFGIKPIILINNKKLLEEVLDDNDIRKTDREMVLREIDKIDRTSKSEVRKNLKKFNAENVLDSMGRGEKYFSQFSSYKELISLIDYCVVYGLKVLFSPSIVRGLSYYNGNIFEIKAKGIKETIVAGGSYKINGIQGTGISFGLERLEKLAKIKTKRENYLVVSLNQDREAIKLAQKLRSKGKSCIIYYGRPSKALDYANSYFIGKVVFIGEKEVKSRKFKVKDMKTGKESVLKI